MAKRAPILSESYNPVGERLKRVVEVPTEPHQTSEQKIIDLGRSSPEETTPFAQARQAEAQSATIEREPIPELPTDKEIKDVSVRFRCTASERRKWHEITRELTGDHNHLSHFVRACLLLLENSHEQLLKLRTDIQRLRKPASTDSLGLTLYEQRIAQLLFDAIKASGRPRG